MDVIAFNEVSLLRGKKKEGRMEGEKGKEEERYIERERKQVEKFAKCLFFNFLLVLQHTSDDHEAFVSTSL